MVKTPVGWPTPPDRLTNLLKVQLDFSKTHSFTSKMKSERFGLMAQTRIVTEEARKSIRRDSFCDEILYELHSTADARLQASE